MLCYAMLWLQAAPFPLLVPPHALTSSHLRFPVASHPRSLHGPSQEMQLARSLEELISHREGLLAQAPRRPTRNSSWHRASLAQLCYAMLCYAMLCYAMLAQHEQPDDQTRSDAFVLLFLSVGAPRSAAADCTGGPCGARRGDGRSNRRIIPRRRCSIPIGEHVLNTAVRCEGDGEAAAEAHATQGQEHSIA